MKNRRRRRYFINRSVQLRHMGMSALIVFIAALIAGWSAYSSIWYVIAERVQNEPQLHQILSEINKILLVRSILVILAGICCAVIITLFVSHRTAGPIFRIRKTLEDIGSGLIPGKIKLRTRDEFKELADAVNSVITKAEEMTGHNKEALDNIKKLLGELKQAEKKKMNEIEARVDEIMLFKEK